MIKVYVFGNQDVYFDSIALKVANQLDGELHDVSFVVHDPVEDFVPKEKNIMIMDSAMGISDVMLLEDFSVLDHDEVTTMHDFDIGFNLKLLKKIGKIKSAKIIAIPNDLEVEDAVGEVRELISTLV